VIRLKGLWRMWKHVEITNSPCTFNEELFAWLIPLR
jgi:hypothetical protein